MFLSVYSVTHPLHPSLPPGAFYLVFEYMDHDLMGLLESGLVQFSQEHRSEEHTSELQSR